MAREQPQLVDLFGGQWRQIAGQGNQTAIATLVDGFASRLRFIACGYQLDFQRRRIKQRRHYCIGLFEFAFLVVELCAKRSYTLL